MALAERSNVNHCLRYLAKVNVSLRLTISSNDNVFGFNSNCYIHLKQ